MNDSASRPLATLGDANPLLNWRAQMRLNGINRRIVTADRGYLEQPGEQEPASSSSSPPPTQRPPNLIPLAAIEREAAKRAAETTPLPPPSENERVEPESAPSKLASSAPPSLQPSPSSDHTWVSNYQIHQARATEVAAKKVRRGGPAKGTKLNLLDFTTEQKLAAIREALSLGKGGKAAVAKKLGISPHYLTNWCRGEGLGPFGNKDNAPYKAQFAALMRELKNGASAAQTMASSSRAAAPAEAPVSVPVVSAPRSRRLPKPPPMVAMMPGFEEWLRALIFQVSEEAVAAFMAKNFGVRGR